MQRDLEGKVAIVTGAASGIGLAMAKLLQERGGRLVAQDLDPAVSEVFAEDERTITFVGDAGKEADAIAVVARAVERFGGSTSS